MSAPLKVVVVYPDLLGTYGDGGNGVVLKERLVSSGWSAELISVESTGDLPGDGDFYVIGGGEDGPQALAARRLIADGGLEHARDRGAVIFGVCAGFQLLSRSFFLGDGKEVEGLGLVPAVTRRMSGPRAVGEILLLPNVNCGHLYLTGYENHGGGSILDGEVEPLGRVVVGVGNVDGASTDGAVVGSVVCTYMHGPALARNPGLADYLIRLKVGESFTAELPAFVQSAQDRLHDERVEQALRTTS